MKVIKSKIDVEISNIEVDEQYYSFEYIVKQDGIVIDEGEYSDDYENGDTPTEWKKQLEDGYAVQQVIVRAFA